MESVDNQKFIVVAHLTECSYIHGYFYNLADAEQCVEELKEESKDSANLDGATIQEMDAKGDFVYFKNYDFT
jgi:hypothetical protein